MYVHNQIVSADHFFHAYMTGQVDILLKWVISVIYIRALRQIKDNKHDKHILLHL